MLVPLQDIPVQLQLFGEPRVGVHAVPLRFCELSGLAVGASVFAHHVGYHGGGGPTDTHLAVHQHLHTGNQLLDHRREHFKRTVKQILVGGIYSS